MTEENKAKDERIKELTDEQVAALEEYYDWGVKVGLMTLADAKEPNRKEKIRDLLNEMYQQKKFDPPKEVVWVKGPIEAHEVLEKYQIPTDVRRDPCYGSHESPWLALYLAYRHVVGFVEETEELQPLTKLAELGMCWFWPCSNVCIICDLPHILSLDNNGQLHSENGPAVLFGDGWKRYAWHGVLVDEDIILHPEKITLDRIRAEQNVEMARVLTDRYGRDRYVSDLGLEPVHEDAFGKLYRATQGETDIWFVRVEDKSTDHVFFLEVPPDCETAHAAVAWTFGLTPETYNPAAES